jgi:hypothetical protein
MQAMQAFMLGSTGFVGWILRADGRLCAVCLATAWVLAARWTA